MRKRGERCANQRHWGLVYYHTVLNITWVSDANLAASNTFGVSGISGSGTMNWNTAQSWIAAMNSAAYLGVTNWRQVSVDVDGDTPVNACLPRDEVACRDNELFYMRYHNSGFGPSTPFTNIQDDYWSGTEYALNTSEAWFYDIGNSHASHHFKTISFHTWAVAPGDPFNAAVPIPAGVWFFASGIGVLGWLRRKPWANT